MRLPLSAGLNEAHVPILVSSNIGTVSKIIVVFGDPIQDMGIWAYRTVGSEGINAGSAVSLAKAVFRHEPGSEEGSHKAKAKAQGPVALLLANTGQLIWHCGSGRAVTNSTWLAMPRASSVEPPPVMTRRNKIPGSANWQEHVESVFQQILTARGRLVKQDAKIGIIGLAGGGSAAIRYLAKDCKHFRGRGCHYSSLNNPRRELLESTHLCHLPS